MSLCKNNLEVPFFCVVHVEKGTEGFTRHIWIGGTIMKSRRPNSIGGLGGAESLRQRRRN